MLVYDDLKTSLKNKDPYFWENLKRCTQKAASAEELLILNNYKRKADKVILIPSSLKEIKIAIIGGYTFHPLNKLIEQIIFSYGCNPIIFTGEYDNYISEIMDLNSHLYEFKPEVVIILPPENKCKYIGKITDSIEKQKQSAENHVMELLNFCNKLKTNMACDIILANYFPSHEYDMGAYATKTMGSDKNYKKYVNLCLGLTVPDYVHILDLEFLASRYGLINSYDNRAWYETKQLANIALLYETSKELAHLIDNLRKPSKKVVVLDLDNTLWGGVIGDDDIQGIEIGDTSPRGEAFKDFQKYIKSLKERGFLIAICSKNNEDIAKRPFLSHPEMVLRLSDIVSFKANWSPKSDNIKNIAEEMNLGLDSFVFIDDNPAEIAIVNQFLPMVSTILLPEDPSDYTTFVKNSRHFEIKTITKEDQERTDQYHVETQRASLKKSVTDMDSYLDALNMKGIINKFNEIDAPRITQLINKSNQFNLTTKRRSESEVLELIKSKNHACFTMRLSDKFGDYGLISIVICEIKDSSLDVETFLMSCRVLERGVEQEVINKILRLAKTLNMPKITASYILSSKNAMVNNLYEKFGFSITLKKDNKTCYALTSGKYEEKRTKISIEEPS